MVNGKFGRPDLFTFNSLPDDIFLEWTKFKALAEDNLNVAIMVIFVFNSVEKIVGKGDNAGYKYFLLSHNVFEKLLFF